MPHLPTCSRRDTCPPCLKGWSWYKAICSQTDTNQVLGLRLSARTSRRSRLKACCKQAKKEKQGLGGKLKKKPDCACLHQEASSHKKKGNSARFVEPSSPWIQVTHDTPCLALTILSHQHQLFLLGPISSSAAAVCRVLSRHPALALPPSRLLKTVTTTLLVPPLSSHHPWSNSQKLDPSLSRTQAHTSLLGVWSFRSRKGADGFDWSLEL